VRRLDVWAWLSGGRDDGRTLCASSAAALAAAFRAEISGARGDRCGRTCSEALLQAQPAGGYVGRGCASVSRSHRCTGCPALRRRYQRA
jgi:hypothetical protein